MTTEAHDILQAVDLLPENDQQEVAAAILRRTLTVDAPPLTDDDLTQIADELFVELDQRELVDGQVD